MKNRRRDDWAVGAGEARVSDRPGGNKPVKADARVFDSRLEAAHEAASASFMTLTSCPGCL